MCVGEHVCMRCLAISAEAAADLTDCLQIATRRLGQSVEAILRSLGKMWGLWLLQNATNIRAQQPVEAKARSANGILVIRVTF